jgi:hypothetical protein
VTRFRERRFGALVSSTLVMAILLSLPNVATATASKSSEAGAAAAATWAYGAEKTISASGTSRNGTFSLTAHFGYQVLVEQSLAAGGVVSLSAHRTMGASFIVTYCVPACTRPVATATLTYHAFEVIDGFANFTRNGTVHVGNASVPALGLLNSASRLRAGAFENDSATVRGLLAVRTSTAHLATSLNGQVVVNFTPALGLIPLAPASGEQWSSAAAYTGSASWAVSFDYGRHAMNGTSVQRTGGKPGSLPLAGNVTLTGTDQGPLALSNVSSSQRVSLLVNGPFRLREGFLVIPTAVDLFGGGSVQGAPTGNGSVGSSFSALDYAGGSGNAPLGFAASSAVFNTATSDPGATSSSTSALAPAVESSGPVILQAQPESPGVVPHDNACLLSGSCSAAPGATGATLRGGFVLVLAVVVLTALIGGVLVSRRPRVPPRANSELYPQVGPAPPAPRAAAKPASLAPKLEPGDDPLGHLW